MAHELLLSSVCTDRLSETLQGHTKHLLSRAILSFAYILH